VLPPAGSDVENAPTLVSVAGRDDSDRAGTSDGRYTLRRELARGGMGRIWIADDARLSRTVAIKELLEPTGNLRPRFDRELALTSRLEHPAIVSIHDGGVWPDGKPFYVMKLVSGKSLDRVIARATTLPDRIALVPHALAVVDAIAYAHAQGIVHRDLKPANVLVGDFGETVVIDWGLAKDLRASTPELIDGPYRGGTKLAQMVGQTVGGEILGTPAYMPPEQALGDAVDERADVYALGALLYHVLSGTPPHGGSSVDELLANVISEPPPPLATRAPGVPADLVAIVEKAMGRRPQDRYPSAAELAVDLKRFASGQLVAAHRYTGGQLLSRWLRKHRTAVIVGSVALVALATLAVVSFTRIVREQREAQAARVLAEQQRGAAERNHTKAESLVTFMLTELRGKLEPVGKLDLLESVALQARDYYRDQAEAKTPDEQHRRALALHGVGQVLALKGEQASALAQHRAALAIHERLAARDPRWQGDLAASYLTVGEALHGSGDSAGALAMYDKALALNEKLVAAQPDDAIALDRLARSWGAMADHDFDAKRDVTAALQDRRKELELRVRVAAKAPDDASKQRDVVKSHAAVADMLMHAGDFAAAMTEHETALELASALVARDPADAASQTVLADRLEEVGGLHHNQGELPAGRARYEQALAIRERLASADPLNSKVRAETARAHMNIGQVSDDMGDLAGALVHQRAALDIFDQLVHADASNFRLRVAQAFSQRLIGSILLRSGKTKDAVAQLTTSRASTEKLASEDGTNASLQRDLAYVYSDLADALAEQRDFVASLELRHRQVAIVEKLLAADSASTSLQIDVIDALGRLGETHERAGHPAEAVAALERALAMAEALGTSNPRWDEMRSEIRATIARVRKKR
jgi:tetratricopeptide (TPR) repeat protein